MTALAVAGAVVVSPAIPADDEYAPGPRTVEVGPGKFKNETTRVLVNENVTSVLKDDVEYKHSIAFSHPPNAAAPTLYELDPANPDARSFTVTFDQPGYHNGMLAALPSVPDVTAVAEDDREVGIVAGTPRGVDLVAAGTGGGEAHG